MFFCKTYWISLFINKVDWFCIFVIYFLKFWNLLQTWRSTFQSQMHRVDLQSRLVNFINTEPWVFLLLRVTYFPAQLLQVLIVAPLKNVSKIQDSNSVQMYKTFWKLNNSHYHFWIILTWVNIIYLSRNKG